MKTINAREYGIFPDSAQDMTIKVAKMLSENPCETNFLFEKGKYHFYAATALEGSYHISNTYYYEPRKLSILIKNMSNISFDGNESEFCFHGQSIAIAVDGSSDVTIKNSSIDWDIPLSCEGMIKNVGIDYFDVRIDRKLYPHFVKEEKLYFTGEDWVEPYGALTVFNGITKKVAYRLGDAISDVSQMMLEDGTVRFFVNSDTIPNIGDYVVLRHNRRLNPGIFLNDSKDLFLENVTIHNTGGLGILAQFCENIKAHAVSFIPNEEKGRKIVSGHDDGLHFSNIKGKVEVDHCYFYGLMDDPLNLHGTAANVLSKITNNKLECRFETEQSIGFNSWANAGDQIALIEKGSMAREFFYTVKSYKLLSETNFEIEFVETIEIDESKFYAVENMDNTAELVCTNNYFGSCRARGVLVSTPKSVFIANNLFESAGSAILVAGDANYWYESGGCSDVVIQDNVFSDCCLTSEYQFCEAIISICPEISKPDINKPFHRNISIKNNKFHPFDYPVLYALSVDNLEFNDNVIVKSNTYEAYHQRKNMITLEYCSDVTILNNQLIGKVLGKDISFKGMNETDIDTDGSLMLCDCSDR